MSPYIALYFLAEINPYLQLLTPPVIKVPDFDQDFWRTWTRLLAYLDQDFWRTWTRFWRTWTRIVVVHGPDLWRTWTRFLDQI